MFKGFTLGASATVLLAGVLVATASVPAEARRVCKGSHLHIGSSDDTARSKREAIQQAERVWSSFTAFEYGTHWANYRRAVNKRVACAKEDGLVWSCQVEATPCRS